MKKIMLVCNLGMSTSLMVNRMQEAADKLDEEIEVFAAPEPESYNMIDQVSIVMLGPQVSYLIDDMKKIADKCDVPVTIIDSMDYGRMNGEKVLKEALEIVKGNK